LLTGTLEGKVPAHIIISLTHRCQPPQRCSACQMEMKHIPFSIILVVRNIRNYSF